MKETDKTSKQFPGRLNGILLSVYIAFVFTTEYVIRDAFPNSYLLILIPVVLVLSILVCPFILRQAAKLKISPAGEKERIKGRILRSIIFFAIPLAVLLIYFFAYYPGCFSYDSFQQYDQAISNHYSDWHPVMHTLFAFKLPLVLTGGWKASIILFQIILFATVLGYSFSTVCRYTNMKITVLIMAYLLLNPLLGAMTMFPWKDTTFAIGTLLLFIYAFRIYMTKGGWIRSPLNMTLFILDAAFITLIRHNGILFTAFIIFAVFFCISAKRSAVLCLCILVLVIGVRVPAYSAIGVEKPGNRKVETLGLPMTVIGAAVTNTPDLIDEDIKQFAYQIAPKEVWQEKYVIGSFQQVKFDDKANTDIVEEYGTQKVVSMMFRCFRQSPEESFKALIKLTEASYTITDEYNDGIILGIQPTDSGNQPVQSILREYCYFTSCCFPYLFIRIGVLLLLLIVAVLSKCRLNSRKDLKKVLFVLPVFAYNYGTSLLLTGNELTTRFFFYTFVLVPFMLAFLFIEEGKESDSSVVLTA